MTNEQLEELAEMARELYANTVFAAVCDGNEKEVPPKLRQEIFDGANVLAMRILAIVNGVDIDGDDKGAEVDS